MTTITEVDQLLTKEEVAHILKVKVRWVESKRDNRLPRVKVGRLIRYRASDVQEFIENNTDYDSIPAKGLKPVGRGKRTAA
ncbi:MAG: helix-turn-helix domain-containing protein [Candidatus Nanopelagicales bacterium]